MCTEIAVLGKVVEILDAGENNVEFLESNSLPSTNEQLAEKTYEEAHGDEHKVCVVSLIMV
jgi:hypothetical protein